MSARSYGGAGRWKRCSPVVRAPNEEATGGRGMMIVTATSLDWGFEQSPQGGKTTWVMFGLDSPTFEDWRWCDVGNHVAGDERAEVV